MLDLPPEKFNTVDGIDLELCRIYEWNFLFLMKILEWPENTSFLYITNVMYFICLGTKP